MHIWGAQTFDNDAAQAWLDAFGENDFRLIDRTLAGAANLLPQDHLDDWEAAEVLAAAECIAAACGLPAPNLPPALQEWLVANQPIQVKPLFITMAQQAVQRVYTQSDLQKVWAATEHFDLWETAVTHLLNRLNQLSHNTQQPYEQN